LEKRVRYFKLLIHFIILVFQKGSLKQVLEIFTIFVIKVKGKLGKKHLFFYSKKKYFWSGSSERIINQTLN